MARSTIKGLDKLITKLKKLPEAAEKEIKIAMEQGAEEVVAMMKSLAPVDDGDLQMSISWTWGEAPKYSQKIASVKSKDGRLAITIFAGNTKVRYAHLVEFGTAPHINGGIFAGTKNPGARKQPFFYVAFRAKRRKIQSRISRAITKSANQVAGSGGS